MMIAIVGNYLAASSFETVQKRVGCGSWFALPQVAR